MQIVQDLLKALNTDINQEESKRRDWSRCVHTHLYIGRDSGLVCWSGAKLDCEASPVCWPFLIRLSDHALGLSVYQTLSHPVAAYLRHPRAKHGQFGTV